MPRRPDAPRLARRASTAMLAAALAVGASACSATSEASGDANAEPSTDEADDRDARLAAVREARDALGPAAVELVEALGAARSAALEGLGPGEPEVRVRRARAAATAVDEGVDDATAASALAAAAVTRTDDTAAAVELLGAARRAAETWAASAMAVLERPTTLAGEVDALRALAEGWDEPASRRVQLDRFAALADEAQLLAEAAGERAAGAACWSASEVVATAASNVASASLELRELVESFSGNAFDDRRDELRDDPLGLPEGALDAAVESDVACLAEEDLAVPAEIAGLVDALEVALTPADLTTG